MKHSILFLALLGTACSSYHKIPATESSKVSDVVQELKNKNPSHDPTYVKTYEAYLSSAEEVLKNRADQEKLDAYLKSLIEDAHKINLANPEASEHVFVERDFKLQNRPGGEVYTALKDNYEYFRENNPEVRVPFPL